MSSELLIIQLDENLQQINEKSIIRPYSYEDLRLLIKKNFGINFFEIHYFDINSKDINITNNEEFKRSGDIIFIIEGNFLKESAFEKNNPNLDEYKKEVIDEKYCCIICSEKFTENPYYCYQCTKKFCKECLTEISKKNNPLKCPYCKYELEFHKWRTLKNFEEEKNQFLGLIEESIKLKNEILNYNKKENMALKHIKRLNNLLNEANKEVKDLITLNLQKNEEIKELKEEIKKLKLLTRNQRNEKNEFLLFHEKEEEINKLKEELNYLQNKLQKSYEKNIKIEPINSKIIENQRNMDDYFIYNVNENHFDEIGYINILGDAFVKNNNGSLIINDTIKLDNLVSKYELKIGINKIKIIMDKNQFIDFSYMFFGCNSLINISPLKNWNVNYVDNFCGIFYGCESLTDITPLKNWDVSSGNNFSWMFYDCDSLTDISPLKNWNVSKVNNFSGMFSDCKSLNDISPLKNWNVSNGDNFSQMFKGCKSLKDISILKDWNVINGYNFSLMFSGIKNISEDVIKNFKKLNINFVNDSFN